MRHLHPLNTGIVIATLAAMLSPALASLQPAVRYRVLEGSTLTGGPDGSQAIPIRGSFELIPIAEGDVMQWYDVEHVLMTDATGMPLTGSGWYLTGADLAPDQQMHLTIAHAGHAIEFDSGTVVADVPFPLIEITLWEAPVPPWVPYQLHLRATPMRQVWFSTDVGLTSGALNRTISDGDELNSVGSLIASNADLMRNMGVMPVVPDVGLDALQAAETDSPARTPLWWEQWFSAEDDVFSETLGDLGHGDLFSEGGWVVATNVDLIVPLTLQPIPDVGLDAIAWGWECNCWLISTEVDFWAEYLLEMASHGSVLCTGCPGVFMTNEMLLRSFAPTAGSANLGLDALHVWPSGEVWFSVEEGFLDARYGWISDGDLLSDRGWIIYRNLDLVHAFQPVEDLDNFGLDALHVAYYDDGDANCDGYVNFGDIDAFVMALTAPLEYRRAYWDCDVYNCDMNGDARINFGDIDPFVARLTATR